MLFGGTSNKNPTSHHPLKRAGGASKDAEEKQRKLQNEAGHVLALLFADGYTASQGPAVWGPCCTYRTDPALTRLGPSGSRLGLSRSKPSPPN